MIAELERRRLVVCGDSNLVIRQVRCEIDCKAPGLTLLKQKVLDHLRKWGDDELVHMKRDWNGSADSLASAALRRESGIEVHDEADRCDLITLNRLDEVLIPRVEDRTVQVSAVATRAARARSGAAVLREELIREMRVDRIRRAQDEEIWIAGLKKYLVGQIADFTRAESGSYAKIASEYEVAAVLLPTRAEIEWRSRPPDEAPTIRRGICKRHTHSRS